MPKLISFEEDNIYVVDVEQSIRQIPSEQAKLPVVVSLMKSDSKPFLIISYKEDNIAAIKKWRTWLTLEDFTEHYKYLIVHIDKERQLCKVCGPVYSSLKSNAYIVAAGTVPEITYNTIAESEILSEERKKIVRYSRDGKITISILEEEGKCIHYEFKQSSDEEKAQGALAFIIRDKACEFLESEKWVTLEEMQTQVQIPSLLSLCKTAVQRFWRAETISNEQINGLPQDSFDDLKAKIEFDKKLFPHLNFLKKWLDKHKEQEHYIEDILAGTFKLARNLRASGDPGPFFPHKLDLQLQKITFFDFDYTFLNKIRIVARYEFLRNVRLAPYKISSCLSELNVIKNLILCSYVANHLQNQLTAIVSLAKENPAKQKEIDNLQNAMKQLCLKYFYENSLEKAMSKLTKDKVYINIYNIGSENIILWVGKSTCYHGSFTNIVEFIKNNKLLDQESLELLSPENPDKIIEETTRHEDSSEISRIP